MSFAKNLSNKYSRKLIDTAKKTATDALKTTSKRAIQNTAEATGDLIDNKIADKITSIPEKSVKKLHSNTDNETENAKLTTNTKRYISTKERQKIIDELSLVPVS